MDFSGGPVAKTPCSQCRRPGVQSLVSSVQFSSVHSLWLGDPMDCTMPGFPVLHHLWSLLKLMSIESAMLSYHLILCHPLLLLPSIFPSIRVFSNESVLHIRWPKYWNFSFSICSSNEYSGLISFRMDWLDFLAVQGTPKSLLQQQSSNVNSSALSLFYCLNLTSMRDSWQNNCDKMDLCWQNNAF